MSVGNLVTFENNEWVKTITIEEDGYPTETIVLTEFKIVLPAKFSADEVPGKIAEEIAMHIEGTEFSTFKIDWTVVNVEENESEYNVFTDNGALLGSLYIEPIRVLD